MKTKSLFLLAISAMAAFAISCNNNGKQDKTTASNDSLIDCLELDMNIKSASQSFTVDYGEPDMASVLTISTNVQWPEKIGDYDIKVLQDSIIAIAFPGTKATNISDAIVQFISNPDSLEVGAKTSKIPADADSLINDPAAHYATTRVQMLEISDELATFNVTSSFFLGGAHPNTLCHPFTYDLSASTVIDFNWIFKQGSEKALEPMVKEMVAAQLGLSDAQLDEAIIADSFFVSKTVYVLNGLIYFHYEPYELLSYNYGAVDAPIQPFEVRDMLTPNACKLFNL